MNPASPEELKSIKGIIYGIFNKISRMWYIGQTIRTFDRRYVGGFINSKFNTYMSRACEKYGEENFEIYILHGNISDPDALNKLEVKSIEEYNSLFPNGYNFERGGQRYDKKVHPETIKKIAEKSLKFREKEQRLIAPNGEVHTFKNQSIFAAENNLDPRVLSSLISGERLVSYRGWHKEGDDPSKPLRTSKLRCLIGPDGKKHCFYDVRKFAQGSIYDICSGKALDHQGYHLEGVRKRKQSMPAGHVNNKKRKYKEIVLTKDGIEYVIKNDIIEFCSKNGINKREVYCLTSGEQKSSRGFSLVRFSYADRYLAHQKETV